jgi:pimeloyl-ACP methyl ester carboxylesterase
MVLLCTSAQLGPPETWSERARTVRAQGTQAVAEAGVGRWLTDGFRAAHPDVAERLRAMIAATGDEGYANCCAVMEHMDLTADLGRITAPTLVIAGKQDPSTPPEHGERIATSIRGAKLAILDPGAHLITVEQPEAVTGLILDHLEA